MTEERRIEIYALAEKYNVIILEDSPYCELRYQGEPVPPIKSFDNSGRVVYVGSYSKTIAPGIRVGFVSAHRDIIAKLTVAKQASDVHTNLFFQTLVSRYLATCDFGAHIQKCCELYTARRDVMVTSLHYRLGDRVRFVRPDGGLFLWLQLNEPAVELCARAKAKKLLCVPGNVFAMDESLPSSFIRLNFSLPNPIQIETGITRLAEALHDKQ
jgi:2-aminoadipate transaminase